MLPDPDGSREPHPGAKMDMIFDHTVVINGTAGVEDAIGADLGAWIDDGSRHHDGAGSNGGTSGDNSLWMYHREGGPASLEKSFEDRGPHPIVSDRDDELELRHSQPARIVCAHYRQALDTLDSNVLIHESKDRYSCAKQGVEDHARVSPSSHDDNRRRHW
jgi:hypothetical protein